MIKAGIIGATGYAGGELVRLLLRHPEVQLIWLGSRSYTGETYAEIYRNMTSLTDAVCRGDEMQELAEEADVIFTATPQGFCAGVMNEQILEKAKTGLYNEKSIENVPDDFKKKYFTKVGQSYQISDEIKKHVDFHAHNLLKDKYPTNYDMIVCRNVLIYFTDEAKTEVYAKFAKSLRQGGILFIGSTPSPAPPARAAERNCRTCSVKSTKM